MGHLMLMNRAKEQLLPGIPNEITLQLIAAKLPRGEFFTLSLVSQAWLHAIRSHQVYDARVRSISTETMVVVTHVRSDPPARNKKRKQGTPVPTPDGIVLYSMRDSSCLQLPPIPGLRTGIPRGCQCVSLDGKIYLLGGGMNDATSRQSSKVFVLDISGLRQWKECASMIEGRVNFGLAVMHGKIYVFGGSFYHSPIYGSEVYDPKENVWSPIRPMITLRVGHSVETMGEELVLHGGYIHDRDYIDADSATFRRGDHESYLADFLEIYHPVRDEWRVVMPFGMHSEGEERQSMGMGSGHRRIGIWHAQGFFVVRGKLHSMNALGIHVHNAERNTWTYLHSLSSLFSAVIGPVEGWAFSRLPFPVSGRAGSLVATVLDVLAVDGELVVMVVWYDQISKAKGCCDVRSTGFGSDDKEISWQKVEFSFLCEEHYSTFSSIQL